MESQIKDALREICHVGIGCGMTALSAIVGREIEYQVPSADELNRNGGMTLWYQSADDYVVGASLPFDGDVMGIFLVMFQPSLVQEILEQTFGRRIEWNDINDEMLDIVREAANIMASAYLSALSAYTSWDLNVGRSAVSMDMAGSMIGEAAGIVANTDRNVFCIDSRFGTRADEEENRMLVLLAEHSLPEFSKMLEGDIHAPDCNQTK